MSRSIIRRNKWVVLAGVLLVLSVILSLLIFGQTVVQADSTTTTLKVNAPAGTQVQVLKGGNLVTSGTVAGNQWVTLYVVKDTYDLRLTQNAEVKNVAGVDCTGDSKSEDQLNVLQVNAPANTFVEVLKGGNLVTSGTVAGNQWITLYVVKDTYDLRLTQNAEVKNVAGVDCTGENTSVDQLSLLTVNAPAGTKVKVYVPDTTNEVTSGTVAGNQLVTLYVVSNTYDVYLEQNAGTKTVEDVNVNADTSIDQLCVLKVNAPANTAVQVLTGGSLVTSGTVAGNGWVELYVVKGSYDLSYDLQLTQNAEVKSVGVDCTGDNTNVDQLSVLNVNAPSGTKVKVYVPDTTNLVTSGTVAGNQWVALYVISDTYDVYLEQNAGTKTVEDVNVNADTSIDQLCVLKVNAPASTAVQVLKGDNLVTSGTVAGNQWVELYVVKGFYDLKLTQGAEVKAVAGLDCSGDNTSTDQLAELKVNAPANTFVEVLKGGNLVTSGTVAGNQWITLYVVKDTYDLRLTQNAEVKNVAGVDCTGENTSVDQLSLLTVNAPAGTKVKVYVPDTTNEVTSGTVAGNQLVTLYVVSDTYDVYLEQNAGTKTVEDVNVNADTSIDQLCVLTVMFPGRSGVDTYVKVDDTILNSALGGDVDNRTNKTEVTSIAVLKNTYDVVVVNGSSTFIVDAVDCTGDTALVIIQGDQTITFGALADKTYGDDDFTVSATSSAGLEVSFTASGACTISGTTVHITGSGSCTITAHQDGNIYYNAAPDVSQSFNVNKKPITVTADPQTKVYGTSDPALTYKITSGALVGSDSFSGALTRDAGEDVGTYAIGQGTLALSENYNLTYVGNNLAITQAAITVMADPQTKVYGASDPALTYKITSGALVGSDAFTGALTRDAGEDIGTYAITQGTLSLSGNYALTYVSDKLTITQASTEVVLTSSCNPSLHLLPVTFTATVAVVAPGVGTPTGTVTFRDGTTTLGTATLSSGKATYRTPCLRPLRLGDHSITAVYNGDANFTTSTSPAMTQTVLSLLQWILRLLGH